MIKSQRLTWWAPFTFHMTQELVEGHPLCEDCPSVLEIGGTAYEFQDHIVCRECLVVRVGRYVQGLKANGESIQAIMAALKMSERTVYRLLEKGL